MKKLTVILVSLIFICAMNAPGFAQAVKAGKNSQASADIIKGKVVSVDAAKNEIVLESKKTGAQKTITVDSKTISSIKVGEEVRVRVKEGTNVAESVREVVKTSSSVKTTVK